MDDLIQHLDEYLDGDLSVEMEERFRRRLAQDATFKNEIELHAKVRKGIDSFGRQFFKDLVNSVDLELDQEGFFSSPEEQKIIGEIESLGQDDFKSMLGEVDQELAEESFYEQKISKTKVFRLPSKLVAIAAAIAVLIVSLLVIWSNPTNDPIDLFRNNFVAISDQITPDVLDEQSELGFVGADGLLDTLAKAMMLYTASDYNAFLDLTDSLLTANSLNHYLDRILLHRGIAFLNQGMYEQAFTSFNASKHKEADWYTILSYLAQDQVEAALLFYDSLDEPSEQIQQLISKL